MKKRISIIGSVGLPANYGGWETLVNYLTINLASDVDIEVYCSAKVYDSKLESYNGAKLQYINLNANGVQSIPYDLLSMIRSVKTSDTFLILGVSGCVFLPLFRIFTNKRLIVNIDGLEWKREKWGWFAKKFLKLSEGIAVKFAHVTVADNAAIKDYIRKEYNKDAVQIAYGGDHVKKIEIRDESQFDVYPFLKSDYAFKVCRIEPENNIKMILDGFKLSSNIPLVLVGNWENSSYGKRLKKEYSQYSNLVLLDPIYDQDDLNLLRSNCLFYVHGHSAGGTNPSLVEAMSLGLPVLAYGVQYNISTTLGEALYFESTEELRKLINEIDDAKLSQLSSKMKSIAVDNYTWSGIAKNYESLF